MSLYRNELIVKLIVKTKQIILYALLNLEINPIVKTFVIKSFGYKYKDNILNSVKDVIEKIFIIWLTMQ